MNITLMLYFQHAKYGVSRLFVPLYSRMVLSGTTTDKGYFGLAHAFFVPNNQPYYSSKQKKLMIKTSKETRLFRMFFIVSCLLETERGLTINELSVKWQAEIQSEEPLPWKTFDRDRQEIGTLFGIYIDSNNPNKKNREEARYFITNPDAIKDNENLDFAWKAIRLMGLNQLYALDGIRLDIHHFVDDVEKVLFFGDALKNNRTLKICYQKFEDCPVREVDVEPYWLKDYEDRMYLIAHITTCQERRKVYSFSLDRILHYEILPTKRRFHVPPGMNPISYYYNVCGIVVPENAEPEKIRIRAYKDEPSYLLTKKLHHSQKLVGEWDKTMEYADFDLFLIPNNEFKAKLISRINRLEVLSPQSLREDILTTLDLSASRYRGA